jgi:hypothetical protein
VELTGLRAAWASTRTRPACGCWPARPSLGGQLQWLITQDLRDAPVLWWTEASNDLGTGGAADLESQAWQAGVDEVLWSHQTDRHGRQFERALARHQSPGGLSAVLRHRQQNSAPCVPA